MGPIQEYRILTKEKFVKIIQKHEKTSEVELLKVDIKEGSEKGDNYSGEVMACDIIAKVAGTEKEYHWMMKIPPSSIERLPVNRAMRMEEKEIAFYHEIMPKWQKMIKDRGAKFELHCHPSPYAEFNEEHEKGSILVMENLCHIGYSTAENKKKGLSVAYAKAALEELAKFHALGYAYLKNYPGGLKEGVEANEMMANDYLFANPHPLTKQAFTAMSDTMKSAMYDLIQNIEEPGQELLKSIKAFDEEYDLDETRARLYGPEEGQFNTLCHGDTWFNNMLFKHVDTPEGKEPVHASLIDVALTRYASPCTDLAYFFFLSTTPMMRETHINHLLGHYHDFFTRCLHQLQEDPAVYPFRQLLKDYNKYSFIGYTMGTMILPAILAKKEDTVGQKDIEGDWSDKEKMAQVMKDSEEKMIKAFHNEPQIKIVLGGNLIEMIRRGIFKNPCDIP